MSHIEKDCLNCQEKFQASVREVNRGNAKFCNLKCAAEYNGKNRIKPDHTPNVKCALCAKEFFMTTSKQSISKSGLYFCCREHKDEAQRIGGIKEIHPSHYGTTKCYRDIAFREKEKRCERCGYDKHQAAIVVHHRDRNRNNNFLSNLEVLCCNCHAIEHYGEQNAPNQI